MAGPPNLDFAVIGEPLNKLLLAVGHKLAREWPQRYQAVLGARELMVMLLRTSRMTYLSGLYLGAEKPPDPLRLPEFCATLPVLNRSLLDNVFNVMFLLEDVPARVPWFWEAEWRETRLELDRFVAEYGTLPQWQPWLNELRDYSEAGIAHAQLSPAQTANPKALRSWLNSGAMPNYQVPGGSPLPPNRNFMKYLHDCFYIDLSQQAHGGALGIVKRGPIFLDEVQNDPIRDERLEKNRRGSLGLAIALVLSLASELEAHFEFGLQQQARYVWGVGAPIIGAVEEMYDKRYQRLLS
jgi:hypothetical protein